ncbi:hypothetical protein EV177_006056 [Coemansia sp. RSA 1804]|nr:hypothetical protein EV177_006056 [Coemansia sp. RSA 1804]
MKFGRTLAIASVLVAATFAVSGAQPVPAANAKADLNRRDLVIETVYETAVAHVAKVEQQNDVVVVTVVETAYAESPAAAAAVASSAPAQAAANAVVTVTATATQGAAAPTPVAHTPQQQQQQQQQPATSAAAPSTTPVAAVVAATPSTTSVAAVVAATPSTTPVVVAATPSTTAAASSDSSDSGSGSGSSSDASDWMNEMLTQLNAIRASAGKAALTLSSELSAVAQKHSEYQSSAKSMTHSDPSGTLGSRLNALRVAWLGAAENIAWNQKDVSAVMDAWKNSAGHYANMIGDYTSVGFGVSNLYWTQDFVKD